MVKVLQLDRCCYVPLCPEFWKHFWPYLTQEPTENESFWTGEFSKKQFTAASNKASKQANKQMNNNRMQTFTRKSKESFVEKR